jgi:pyridoxamine 5'-phosphate oxidase
MPKHQYSPLNERDVDPDPYRQFSKWFSDAEKAGDEEPNAMTLATVSKEGAPSARIVLLKGVDDRGFLFFTNYESRKGKELSVNPKSALVFYWSKLRRQVRVEGAVVRVSREESSEYFATRPRESQIGAWASLQSSVIADRKTLEARMEATKERFKDCGPPVPPEWGGYRVVADTIEFWQEREGRLHDRIRYRRFENGWRIDRLSP